MQDQYRLLREETVWPLHDGSAANTVDLVGVAGSVLPSLPLPPRVQWTSCCTFQRQQLQNATKNGAYWPPGKVLLLFATIVARASKGSV